MSNSVNGVNGYGNGYGNYGYYNQNGKNEEQVAEENQTAQPQVNVEETQIDPSKVMDFLAANNIFANVPKEANGVKLDEETVARIGYSMDRFEELYAIVQNEFGAELAPDVMDLVMDKLMGIAA